MKKIILTLSTLILFSLSNTSCKKSENHFDPEFQIFPIELSEEDKSLLNYYYDNPSVTFSNNDDQELVFKTDSLYSIFTGYLTMQYNCITTDNQDFSYQITLYHMSDSTLRLKIIFSTDSDGFYLTSSYHFFPKSQTSIDTIYENDFRVKFDYHDSLTLSSQQFYNVFQIMENNHSDLQMGDCYYTNEFGVIGFKTSDNKFWIKKTQ